MARSKWRLALIATGVDLVYIALTIVFKHFLSNVGNAGLFLSYYLPYYLHFPLTLLFFGLNYWFMYFFLAIQTFLIFFLIGLGFEKNKKKSIIMGIVFYLILVSLGIKATLDDRAQQKIVTEKDIEQVLKNDLPVGAQKEKVVAYLKEADIDFNIDQQGTRIEAMERNINKELFTSASFQIVFNFGVDGKLTGFTIVKKLTGP